MRTCGYAMLGVALSACAGPKPALAPGAAIVVPADWRSAGLGTRAMEARWWEQFQDPALNALVERALAGNVDLLIAGSRIAEARA
jgi:multidrug efflux system outer membrane protein